jgi:hypothetical protein
VRLFGRWRGKCWPGGAAWGREYRRRSSVMQLNFSDTAATSQNGSSIEFIAPIAGRQCYIQDAIGRGLWVVLDPKIALLPCVACVAHAAFISNKPRAVRREKGGKIPHEMYSLARAKICACW